MAVYILHCIYQIDRISW